MLLLTVAAVVEAGVDRPVASVAWLALGPLVASLLLSWRWTTGVACCASLLGLLVVASRPGPAQTGLVQLLVLVGLGAFAVLNCLLRQLREQQLRAVLRVAHVAQAAILQPVPARSARIRFGAQYRSVDPVAALGGDILDVHLTPSGARALIADVTGQGLAAAPLAAVVLASFRAACAQPGLPLLEVARTVNHAVEMLSDNEQLATALFLDLDDRGWAEVVTCGHPPPLRRDPAGYVSALSPGEHTTPLGMSPRLRSDTYCLQPGDRLVAYTDGLLEAENADCVSLALNVQVSRLTTHDPTDAARQLVDAAGQHAGGSPRDDIAVLVLDVDASSEVSATPLEPTDVVTAGPTRVGSRR